MFDEWRRGISIHRPLPARFLSRLNDTEKSKERRRGAGGGVFIRHQAKKQVNGVKEERFTRCFFCKMSSFCSACHPQKYLFSIVGVAACLLKHSP